MYPEFNGVALIPVQTRKGQKNVIDEMAKLGLDLFDAAEILKNGYDCSISRRRKGVIERCLGRGNKTIKVVVQEATDYFGNRCYELIHVGKFTKK